MEQNHFEVFNKGFVRNTSVKFFEFGLLAQEEILFKDISYLELWQPLCSMEPFYLCNFGRVHCEEFGPVV